MTAAYVFGAVDFHPRAADQQPLVSPGESFTSLRHIPYSNYNVLDMGGLGPSLYGPIQVEVAVADAAAFVALLQTRAALRINGVDMGQATLTALTDQTTDPRGQAGRWYQASWILG